MSAQSKRAAPPDREHGPRKSSSIAGRLKHPSKRTARPDSAATIMNIKSAAASLDKNDIDGAERLLEDAYRAGAKRIEIDQVVKALAKSLGVPRASVEDLRRKVEERQRNTIAPENESSEDLREAARRKREKQREELFGRVKHIATSPRLLDDMSDVVARLGVVGERRAIVGTYITVSSSSLQHERDRIAETRRRSQRKEPSRRRSVQTGSRPRALSPPSVGVRKHWHISAAWRTLTR